MSDAVGAEVEAALLALGQRLEWREKPGQFGTLRQAFTSGNQALYTVFVTKTGAFRIRQGAAILWGCVASADAAKAACERHHATGEWA